MRAAAIWELSELGSGLIEAKGKERACAIDGFLARCCCGAGAGARG